MDHRLPEWAPQVPKPVVNQLYHNDAQGMPDVELIDDVGWRLRARCLRSVQAVQAANGSVTCPACENTIPHHHQPEEITAINAAGELPWMEYFKAFSINSSAGRSRSWATFQDYVLRSPGPYCRGEGPVYRPAHPRISTLTCSTTAPPARQR